MFRIGLFLATNLGILLVLSLTLNLLEPWLAAQGVYMNTGFWLVFAAIFGMGGSFVSLALSKWMAKRYTGARVIQRPANELEAWLLDTVRRQAKQAGIGMPEVAIYDAPEINAFATGMKRDDALVAVSSGLLRGMSRDEAEAVLAHEVSHVANGDMVTLALVQGVLNTFVIVLSRLIGTLVDRVVFRNERGHGIGFWVTMIVAEIFLGILASIIVMWFSRYREYRADAGGAALAGRHKMIAALQRLKGNPESQLPDQLEAFGISGRKALGIKRLFMSHPPLDERIAALQAGGC
ncbi:protease HtpX [Alkalilimnicola sp. S0819]|uniref:protease HtpX n=1 Tax=Alkalilimnicola sp. S0819 TaxID=2613922 RepID=UPI00126154C9|nr:protease HtpX [Alkalilimnicola sp. S0819]KAB7627829.1 protease HtpX [Alkalilimnicola sp. S0819]MPQ15461.1 protease HtpX [Alkalilimnicola sp. S0819]